MLLYKRGVIINKKLKTPNNTVINKVLSEINHAILPVFSIEQHGPHSTLYTDSILI